MALTRKTFARLTTADKDYIKRNYDLLSAKQLAVDTGATPAAVLKFMETLPPPPAPTEPKAPEAEAKPQPDVKPEDSITGTPVFRQTPIADEDRGVTVMTPQASQWGDEATKRAPGQNYVENNKDRIFKPRPEKPSR